MRSAGDQCASRASASAPLIGVAGQSLETAAPAAGAVRWASGQVESLGSRPAGLPSTPAQADLARRIAPAAASTWAARSNGQSRRAQGRPAGSRSDTTCSCPACARRLPRRGRRPRIDYDGKPHRHAAHQLLAQTYATMWWATVRGVLRGHQRHPLPTLREARAAVRSTKHIFSVAGSDVLGAGQVSGGGAAAEARRNH